MIWQWLQDAILNNEEKLAIAADDGTVTYKALGEAVAQYASYLSQCGVARGDRVALLLPRNKDLPIALLGVLAVGACYVPLSDRYPIARNQAIIADSQCKFLITTDTVQSSVSYEGVMFLSATCQETFCTSQFIASAVPQDLAYIIYTSGSTGKPKGVMISIANVAAFIQWAIQEFNTEALRFTLASTSICFDLSIFEMLVPLIVGGCVVIVENALSLIDNPPKQPLTLINTVPSALSALLNHAVIPASVQVINLAGEALAQQLVDLAYHTTAVKKVYNLYGPSETTTYSTYYVAEKQVDRVMVPIGRPILGTKIYLLDKHQLPVPKLAKGEIYIVGQGVTLGYCGNEAETKLRYVSLNLGGQMVIAYRTGDLARLNHANELEYLGRLDQQVKINGFRIELDEIVKTIQSHPAVKQAYVLARTREENRTELLAYVVPQVSDLSIDTLLSQLATWLPDYMVPKHVVLLEALPLNNNGKIDRQALPLPEEGMPEWECDYQNDLERTIASIWENLFSHTQFDRESNFFYVGGHSLLAAKLLAKLKAQFNISCTLEELFHVTTIAAQAALVSTRLEQRQPLQGLLPKAERPNHIPLSFGQMRLWYLHYAIPNLPLSNIPILLTIQGALDVRAFEMSLTQILQRHEILRTVYSQVGHEVFQCVTPPTPFKLKIVYLPNSIETDEKLFLAKALAAEANQIFDLSQDLMIRATQFVLSPEKSLLMLTQHHIAADAWSLNVLMQELSLLYHAFHRHESLEDLLLPAPAQYADYSIWQHTLINSPAWQADLQYWRQQLANAEDTIKLPFDRPRGEVQSYEGAFFEWEINPTVLMQLQSLANQQQATLFMVLLAAFNVLLYRYSGQADFCVGILSANRPLDALSHSLGFFVNTLVTRHQVSPTLSLQTLLQQVKTTVLDSLAHQQLPFDKLVEALQPHRPINQHPFFQVLFSLQNALDTELSLDELQIEAREFDRKIAKFDLTVSMVERKNSLHTIFEYNTHLFDEATIQQMISHYAQILEAFTGDLHQAIAEIDLLSSAERYYLLENMNSEQQRTLQQQTINEYFEEIVQKNPQQTAIISREGSVTYQELNHRANQLANELLDYGVGLGTPIGLLLPKSIEAIVSMLAVLKVGGFYVPLDASWPLERLDFILRDADIPLVLTNQLTAAVMPTTAMTMLLNLDEIDWEVDKPIVLPNLSFDWEETCYLMYTSGSTGQPKGVMARHKGVVRLVKATNYVELTSEQRCLQVSPLPFDGSTFDIWGSLLNGATLVLMPDGLPELATFAHYLAHYQITTLFLTTQLFNSLVDHKVEAMGSLKQVLFGGEVASIDHVQRFMHRYPTCKISNIYGPTECTTFALSYLIPANFSTDTPIPIGRPISNTSVVILSEQKKICPIGVAGEIYLGGLGVAKEYLNQPLLTAEKFIENPIPELRSAYLYRTGDLGFCRRDGQIVFVGRVDSQVKRRGFRIELGEIEQCLRELPAILDAVVLMQKPENILVAYVIGRSTQAFDVKQINRSLAYHLPSYMLPDAIYSLEAYPLNHNGKVDKEKLPRWEPPFPAAQGTAADSNEHEMLKIIRQIWGEVLGMGSDSIDKKASFFEVGGNSLKIILVLDKLQQQFQSNDYLLQKLDIVTLFQYPTMESLANYLLEAPITEPVIPAMTKKRSRLREKRQQARTVE